MGTLTTLAAYRPLFADGSRAALVAVAGTDKKRAPSLLRSVKGIGSVKEAQLRERFGTALATLEASDEQLREAGLAKSVIKKLREASG
jgi:excinuclease UvrABC nuclease subunit